MHVDPNNSKNISVRHGGDVYKKFIEEIKKDGICPFCPEGLSKYRRNPILRDGKFWILTSNAYPYNGAKHHLMLIHKKHIENIAELSKEAWDDLLDLIQQETQEKNIQGGTFFMRFGKTNYTGATVTHLHAQLVSPDIDNPDREPILARVG